MKARERAQALVETALVVPACVACAMTIVDCGVLVRDRIATSQAATRAAEARLAGRDEASAARSALPASLRDDVIVDDHDGRIEVRTTSDVAIAQLAGRRIEHRSAVALPGMEGER
jgi:Flp pilus assembly protein TadG